MKRLKIVNVVGARPNFMKIAPIHAEMQRFPEIDAFLLHTGQHYDHTMSTLFFENLGLPEPHFYLGVGSGDHGAQTGRVMIEFEAVLKDLDPDIVVVVGDVNSTIACALVAGKMGCKVAHVEAGLRSFDRTMPEEINRLLTDQISDYLFTTEPSARSNLQREGIPEHKIFFVGNVMIDSLLCHRRRAAGRPVLAELGIEARTYVLVTLHRPSNVDDPIRLGNLIEVLCAISEQATVIFPAHPRTRRNLAEFGYESSVRSCPNLRLTEPLEYLDFLKCMDNASLVVTDSGGIQEETTVLGVPCLTARENTERPVTVTHGTNVLVGLDPECLLSEARKVLQGHGKVGNCPELWDGKASERIVRVLRTS